MESTELDSIDKIRQRCWNKAIEAYGTGYIFEQRANHYRKLLRVLTFLGIAVPVAIGGVALSFSNLSLFPFLVTIAGVLGIVQLIGSVWSIVARWDETYSYALESLTANHELSADYKRLAENPSKELTDFQLRFELVEKVDQLRSATDYKQGITEKEKRIGLRAALRQFQRPCAHCKKVPASMRSSDCEVCGNF